jgi:hypothetical protein
MSTILNRSRHVETEERRRNVSMRALKSQGRPEEWSKRRYLPSGQFGIVIFLVDSCIKADVGNKMAKLVTVK